MKKWNVVVITLGLSGCAAPNGGAPPLHQAAPAPAPTPTRAPGPVQMGNTYRPVGTTLYGVGEAAPHGEEPPRSPNKRVLPPTKEPGFWAADGARASSAKQEPTRLLECTIPVPRTSDGHAMPSFARFCTAHMESILQEPMFLTTPPQMSSAAQRECLVAKMYRLCAETLRLSQSEPEEQTAVGSKESADDWRKWTGETAKVAEAYRRDKCNPETDTREVRKVYALVHREWIRRQPGAVVPND